MRLNDTAQFQHQCRTVHRLRPRLDDGEHTAIIVRTIRRGESVQLTHADFSVLGLSTDACISCRTAGADGLDGFQHVRFKERARIIRQAFQCFSDDHWATCTSGCV